MAEVQQMNEWPRREQRCGGVYSWMLHFKSQFILIETMCKIYDLPRISSWSLWNSYSKWLKSWSWIRQKSVVWPRLITKNGVRVENIPTIHYIGHSRRDRKFITELQCEPEQFKWRIIFMSMYNDIDWGKRGNTEKCSTNSVTVANYARRFPLGRLSFLGIGSENKWYGTYSDKPDGKWDKTAERMMVNFAECGHTIFRATSALERG